MKLYHGSTFIINKPDLEILNYKTDFGKGFYTTTDLEHSKKWAIIKKQRLGSNDDVHKYINVFEYNEDDSLSILNFENATKEWLRFVYKNRQSDQLVHQYDIVKGPVADDKFSWI